MKHGKCPTRAQQELIKQQTSAGRKLDPENWLVVKDTSTEMVIKHRVYGSIRIMEKKKAT